MTIKLYEQDAYCRQFTATVESCEGENGVYRVVLDSTAFFPEGGGQAADEGTINGIKVLDVQCEGDTIVHTMEAALPVGAQVMGELDWELRYSRMQSHTGEHILSGVVHSLYGYSNVGFHMSEIVMTVDFSGPLTSADIEKIEQESNRAIYTNAAITISYPAKEELEQLRYRSKIDSLENPRLVTTRLVTIGNIDCCACCAPHLAKTGEVGLIKVLDFYPNKQGTRLEMVAGIHALNDYIHLNATNKRLMGVLSAPRDGVESAVCEQQTILQTLRNENKKLLQKLALYELKPIHVADGAYAFANGLSYDELRYCANEWIKSGINTCVLLSGSDTDGYIYLVSSSGTDIRPMVKELNRQFAGKGGGPGTYAQGKIGAYAKDDITRYIEQLLQ